MRQCHLPPQEHDAQQFGAYQQLNELLRHPDRLDEPATHQHIVSKVQNQLTCACMGIALEQNESNGATTHSSVFALDLVPDRRPSKGPKCGGHMECHAWRGLFLFYDKLRYVALTKLDEDPTRLAEFAYVLVTIHAGLIVHGSCYVNYSPKPSAGLIVHGSCYASYSPRPSNETGHG